MRLQAQVTTESETVPSVGARAFWPDAVGYREAIQNPRTALGDPELQGAQVVLDRRGLPLAYSGRFAVVFRLRTHEGDWAIRCFTQATQSQERRERYRAIAATLSGRNGHFVPFRYIEQGIRVGSGWFPVLAMRWAEGETLGRWVDRRHADATALRTLGATLSRLLGDLEASGIAHGDWQHDNLLVSEGGEHVTLVDYDGMFVPELTGRASPERGHPNFQHPARSSAHYAVGLDRFSCLVLLTGLRALAREPSLWSRFSDGESLLFKKEDFEDPARSSVFQSLRRLAEESDDTHLGALLTRLHAACDSTGEDAVLLAGEPLPAPPEPLRRVPTPHEKWWLEDAEVVTTAEISAAASPPRPQFVADYLSRLTTQESREAEQRNFWAMRAYCVCIPGLFALWFLFHFNASSFPWFLFINFLNVFSWIYGAWPTKRSWDALQRRTEELNQRLAGLGEEKARKRSEALAGVPYGANTEVGRFVTSYLERIPINRVFGRFPGLGVSTVEELRASGIQTAADLRSRISGVPTLPGHYVTALQSWCRDLEMEAANQYKQEPAPGSPAGGDPAQADAETAECESELDALERERARFPDTSFGKYLRKVFWLD